MDDPNPSYNLNMNCTNYYIEYIHHIRLMNSPCKTLSVVTTLVTIAIYQFFVDLLIISYALNF